jgi:hypothetical protein
MIWHILPRKDEGEADVRGQEMIKAHIAQRCFVHTPTVGMVAKDVTLANNGFP